MIQRVSKRLFLLFALVALVLSVITPLSTPKAFSAPDCRSAEAKDYQAKIDKVVDEIESSKHQEEVTGKENAPEGGKSFRRVFYVYEWNTAILRNVNPSITDKLVLSEEQTKQVFGDGAKPRLTVVGPSPVEDEQGNISYPGEGSETVHAEDATKFDREAMTKIITDKVAAFLAKNPQEICEGGTDTRPGNDAKPGSDTKPGTDSKSADASKDVPESAVSNGKPGNSSTAKGSNEPANGTAATSNNGDKTASEKATETERLATTGAVGLTALGVSVLLVGVGATLAIRHRKQDV